MLVGHAESQPSLDYSPAVFGLPKPSTSVGTKGYLFDVPVSYPYNLLLMLNIIGIVFSPFFPAMTCALEKTLAYTTCSYLHPSITPETIREAKHAGITGVKMYPANVTTGSSQGVTDYAAFYPVMAEMEK